MSGKALTYTIFFGIFCIGGVGGQFQNCWLTSCEKLENLETSSAEMISKQDQLGSAIMNISDCGTTDILDAINSLETSITTEVRLVTSTLTTALTATESTITTAISNSETTITNAISSSESAVTGAVSNSETIITTAISTSETNVKSAISSSESNVQSSIATSEGVVTGALSDTETVIQMAIANSESSITSAISTSESAVTSAVSSSQSTITGAISASQSAITSVISSTESNILNLLDIVNATTVSSETKIDQALVLLNSLVNPSQPPFVKSTAIKEFQIELDIFSGVVNPTWTVSDSAAAFNDIVTVLSGAPSTPLSSILGYRGFLVTTMTNDGTVVMQTFGKGQQSSIILETTLLDSNNGVLSADALLIALNGISGLPPPDFGTVAPLGTAVSAPDRPNCPGASPCVNPAFDVSQWTSTTDNCYNYAANQATGTYAQPGRAAGAMYTDLSASVVRSAAVLDVILDYEDPAADAFPDPRNNCRIGLAVIPGVDFHFLRQDDNGNWSHKPGPRLPSDTDNSGQTISDPRIADIAPYQFVRFLGVCDRKVMVQ